jgi:hypothetical protein
VKLHYPQLGSKNNGGERTHMAKKTPCCNYENARFGKNFEGIPNHYIIKECCHKKSRKNNLL